MSEARKRRAVAAARARSGVEPAGGHDGVGLVGGDDGDGEGAPHPAQRGPGRLGQGRAGRPAPPRSGGPCTSVSVADVRVWPVGLELGPQLGVVLDDPVVDEGQAAGAVDVRVGVLRGRAARGWPSGCGRWRRRGPVGASAVSSASSATEWVPPAARARQMAAVGHQGHPGRVVAPVLELVQAPRRSGTASASPVTPMMPHMVTQATGAGLGGRLRARICPRAASTTPAELGRHGVGLGLRPAPRP